MNYECFYCSSLFNQADSLAKNTSELQSKTYCSKKCEDKDSEDIEKAVKEMNSLTEQDSLKEEDIRSKVREQVAGFKLKVNT